MDISGTQHEGANPSPPSRKTARTGLIGALLGVGAVAGGLMLATGGAVAQSAVPLAGADATEAERTAETQEADEAVGDGFEADLEAYSVCIDEALADQGLDFDFDVNVDLDDDFDGDFEEDGDFDVEVEEDFEIGPDGEELTEAEWEAIEAQWEAIEADLEACEALVPAELAEMDAAFEQCLTENGVDLHDGEYGEEDFEEDDEDGYDEGDFDEEEDDDEYLDHAEAIALIETEDGSTFVDFGEGDAEVSIVKADGEITVNAEGDVATETVTWDDLEEFEDPAFEKCEALVFDDDQ